MKEKKSKVKYEDDGHTIYNMDVDGMPKRYTHKKDDSNKIYLEPKEKFRVIMMAFLHYLPMILCAIIAFTLTMILIYFWLRN